KDAPAGSDKYSRMSRASPGLSSMRSTLSFALEVADFTFGLFSVGFWRRFSTRISGGSRMQSCILHPAIKKQPYRRLANVGSGQLNRPRATTTNSASKREL